MTQIFLFLFDNFSKNVVTWLCKYQSPIFHAQRRITCCVLFDNVCVSEMLLNVTHMLRGVTEILTRQKHYKC